MFSDEKEGPSVEGEEGRGALRLHASKSAYG